MPQALFEHFFKMAGNQHICFCKNKYYVFLYRPHVFVEFNLFYIIWMLDINKVHLSLIEISVVQ